MDIISSIWATIVAFVLSVGLVNFIIDSILIAAVIAVLVLLIVFLAKKIKKEK